MSKLGRDALTFLVLLAVSAALAAVGFVLSGGASGGRGPGPDRLAFPIVVATTAGLYLACGAWVGRRLGRVWPEGAPEDAARGLATFGRSFRVYMVGVTLLILGVQAWGVAVAAGLAEPMGMEAVMRTFHVGFGLLLALFGNACPKIPPIADRGVSGLLFLYFGRDPGRRQKAARFCGWVFMAGGAALAVTAIAAPYPVLSPALLAIAAAMIVLTTVYGLALTFAGQDGGRGAPG